MQRSIIGFFAFLLIIGGLAFWRWPVESEWQCQLQAACWRLGPLLAMLWIAYPQLRHLPNWLWGVVAILTLVLARWPRFFLVAIPILLVLAILKPQFGKRQ